MKAIVVGASGGIGAAITRLIVEERSPERVIATGRDMTSPSLKALARKHSCVELARVDYDDESTIATLAAQLKGEQFDLLFIATGFLQNDDKGWRPERRLAAINRDYLLGSFSGNTIGPLLVIKHLHPLLCHNQRAVIAALSARVGSIGDNRLGGWYAYRASKAALNMAVRGASIELGRRHDHVICVSLHPGTVDTALSEPFQAGVKPEKLFSRDRAAMQLLDVIDNLGASDSGGFFAWDGKQIPW